MDWTDEYNIFHSNVENDTGRGIILYVHNSLPAEEKKMNTVYEENIFVEIKLAKEQKLLLGLIYRSPSECLEEKHNQLRQLIAETATMKHQHYIVMGDFNYPRIEWKNERAPGDNSEEQKFIDCLQEHSLFQCIAEPTRWRGSDEPHTLDLVITKDDTAIEDIEHTSPLGKSDHCVIGFKYAGCQRKRQEIKMKRCFKKANYTGIKEEINCLEWEETLKPEEGTINDTWNNFRKTIDNLANKYVPLVKCGNKNRNIPLDKITLQAIKEKAILSRKVAIKGNEETRKQYNRVRNKVSKLVRKSRKEFERNLAKEAIENPKRIWQYINSKSKTRQGIGDLCTDPENPESKKAEDDETKANILAKFFSSVFTKEDENNIPDLKKRPINKEWKTLKITESQISKALKNLKPDKSPGMDDIQPIFLKELHQELAIPLTIIFNKSLQQRQVPDEWKRAKISAIYKKGKKSLAGNYRPVSLTSIVGKIMESVVRNHLMEHLTENNYLTNKQYGFMPGRSTGIQLIKVLDEWTAALYNGDKIDCIYMDYQKAFDTVPHKRLIKKLKAYNIGQESIEWTRDFLSGRMQQVVVNGKSSEWHEVTSGIPQGSVLGPLMFVIYINDLPENVTSQVYLFADDTKIYNTIKNEEDKAILQEDLEKLTQWSDTWLLRFHPQKCKHLHIGHGDPNPNYEYRLMGNTLEKVHEEKDLGVTIDEKLKFEKHISEKVKKANSMAAVVRRTFRNLDDKTFTPLYKSLVRTHLEYASSVWSPHQAKYVETLESVQRRATKQIPGYGNLPYEERLKKLKLPTLKYRRHRGDMIEMYKLVSGIYDTTTANFLKLRKDYTIRESGRGHTWMLFTQRPRLDIRKHSFTLRAVSVWNSLPDDIVCAKSINSFKNRLDKFWRNQEVLYNYTADLDTRHRRDV